MCGIAGIVTRDGGAPDERLIRRMQQAIQHRGPDAEGVRLFSGCGLTHRRLSIIDLSPAGAQPLTDSSGRFWIVFNGEIYNYRQLRIELESLGLHFQTQTDTEVIVLGYQAWGVDVLKRLRGMFAFAIWDMEKRCLLLARDHIGKKPLFYSKQSNGDVYFASELKAFKAIKSLEIDWDAIRLFLGLQYVPSPKTGFVGVEQLPPGTYAIYANGKLEQHTYLEPRRQTDSMQSQPDTDDQLRTRLTEAVRSRQLASDVPVGAFLSGGVDSAAIVALATKQISIPLKTFTMGFSEGEFDERDQAKSLAMQFGTEHYAFEAKPQDLLRIADDVIQHYDAPYADSSALPLWLLAEQTAKQVKVVLTGDGGDELFGGYRRYLHLIRGQQIAGMPLIGAWTGKNMRRIGTWFQDAEVVRMGRYIEAVHHKPSSAYGELFTGAYFDSHDLGRICKADFLQQTKDSDAVEFVTQFVRAQATASSLLSQALYFDLFSYLPDDLNVKMDRATMRFSLEARSPFLDQAMIDFALQLPLHEKVAHGKTKIALKRAMKGIVPDAVLERQKRGFQVPLAVWFRGPLKQAFIDRCLDPQGELARMIDIEAVKRLMDANDAGANHGNRLWMLYALATWLQNTNRV